MPINFNQPPYYDDFTEDDLMYRLLFQPGRAVQARELTQIQTILQNQVSNLGKHIFKDGSLVTGGQLSYDKSDTKWLAIKELDFKGTPNLIRSITPGLHIRRSAQVESDSWNPKVYGKITEVSPSENGEPDTIFFRWEEGEPEEGQSGFGSNENLIIYDELRQVAKFPVTTLDANADNEQIHYGDASKLSIAPGIYFWKGMFIRSTGGSIVLGKYRTDTSYRIGFAVSENIESNDPKSLDPASGASNYAAPGADRYKIKMQLQKYGDGETLDEATLENFIEVARVVDGELITSESASGQVLYNIIGDHLAQRTYEESGNYLVKPYNITLKNKTSTDGPKLVAKMTDGISYVKGHRRTLSKQTLIEMDKGRDVATRIDEFPTFYGDNRVLVYDRADNTLSNHKEKANGVFNVGAGAGLHTSNVWYGEKGSAVSLHCVPHDQVKDYSLTDQWKWNSTLVGTARPMQMSYDRGASVISNRAGRPGTVYNLWLDDFNSSPITNAASVSNILNSVSAYGNTLFGVFHFSSTTHGITSNDEISVTGQSPWDSFSGANVAHTNATAVLVSGDYSGYAVSDSNALTLRRTTGGTTGLNTVVLDEYSSAPWNDSYVGATIRINNGSVWSQPRTIVGYAGTNASAEALWKTKFDVDSKWSAGTGPAPGRRATVILDRDLDIAPVYGYTYEITMSAKQARSIVHNYNKSSTGTEQYPALLSTLWNIDPVSGVVGGDVNKLSDDFYGGRIDGDCKYNIANKPEPDALLFDLGRGDDSKVDAIKSVMTHGSLDSGMTSNTMLYYNEVVIVSGAAATSLTFDIPATSYYDLFNENPFPYPYDETNIDINITDKDEILANYILVDRTTGKVHTNDLTQVVVTPSSRRTVVTKSGNFVAGNDYMLILPVRARFVEPAYKKLVTGNTTNSKTLPSSGILTDLDRGQISIDSAAYGTTEGSVISLGKPDVFKINRVLHKLDNAAANTDLDGTTKDITDRFVLNTGQRDMFYDNGSIELRGDPPTGNLLVSFDYFKRMDKPKSDSGRLEILNTEPSYFAVDSYQHTTDLLFNETTDGASTFSAGDIVTSNSGATGYIVDFANNTSGTYAKARLEDVSGTFLVDEWISKETSAAKVRSITTADLKYTEIPTYTDSISKSHQLRNMIDMRAYVSSSDKVSNPIGGSILTPMPSNIYMGSRLGLANSTGPGYPSKTYTDGAGTNSRKNIVAGDVGASRYLGRMDKIQLTESGKLFIKKGASSENPVPPREEMDGSAFTIASVTLQPYTSKPELIDIKRNIAVRHTMKDISKLARRVENLEYYVSLNALEQSATDIDIAFADGTTRFKNGIIVDNFQGFNVRNSGYPTARSAIGTGVLRPRQRINHGSGASFPNRGALDLKYISGGDTSGVSASGYVVSDPGHIIIDYDTEEFIAQKAATSLESVNPFDLNDYTGELTLMPETDHWIDSTKVPEYGAVIAGDKDNPIAELSSPEFASLTAAEIAGELEKIDGLWDTISGISHGDDITGDALVYSQTESGGYNSETVSRNIELGDISAQKYNALADIDAAIARAASIDGLIKTIEVLPYVRSRDVVIHATGLKPSWPAGIFFDGAYLEYAFSAATQIYMNVGKGTRTKFSPEVDGSPEKIKLTGDGSRTANAILIAVREPEFIDRTLADNNTKVGYIIPEFTDVNAGKVDWSTYKDGFYTSAWDSSHITEFGFQGFNPARLITGQRSGATSTLQGGTSSLYNGHYTGTARNTDSANTTHIVLSPDAHRYVTANFGSAKRDDGSIATATNINPARTLIKIVAGKGAGLECVANGIVGTQTIGDDVCHVLELRTAGDGTNPLNRSIGGGPGIDDTSVYSIRMQRIATRNGINQLGYPGINANRFGDKIGIMHIPTARGAEWTAGSKLIEIRDRGFHAPWLLKNYASAYYNSGGQRQVFYDDEALIKLQGIRSKLSAYRVNDGPGETITASDENGEGILGVISGITIANGTYTAADTDSLSYVAGPGDAGSVFATSPSEMSAWELHVKHLEDLGYVWMEDLQKFVSIY